MGSCARRPFGASSGMRRRSQSNGFIATGHINGLSEFPKLATPVGVRILKFAHFEEAGPRSSGEILHNVGHALVDAEGKKHEVDDFGGLRS